MHGRRFAAVLLAGLLPALVMAGGIPAAQAAGIPSPYSMLTDPAAANPAAFPWAVVVVTGGPAGVEVWSSNWGAGDVSRLVTTMATSGDLWQALQGAAAGLPEGDEELHATAAARVGVSALALQVGYGLMTQVAGTLPAGFIAFLKDASGGSVAASYDVTGTALLTGAWSDVWARVNAPIPVLPRMLGLESLSVGAGVHRLTGLGYLHITADGEIGPPPAPVDFYAVRATEGSGWAFDAGVVAGLPFRTSLEAAVVGLGSLTWNSPEEATTLGSNGQPEWARSVVPVTYDLPATLLVALHAQPLPMGLMELTGGYARIGFNRQEAFERLFAQVDLSALGMLRAGLGLAKDSNEPDVKLYGQVGVGLGVARATVRASNLQEISKGPEAKSLGVSLVASIGF